MMDTGKNSSGRGTFMLFNIEFLVNISESIAIGTSQRTTVLQNQPIKLKDFSPECIRVQEVIRTTFVEFLGILVFMILEHRDRGHKFSFRHSI
jgi:hypothetical protein